MGGWLAKEFGWLPRCHSLLDANRVDSLAAFDDHRLTAASPSFLQNQFPVSREFEPVKLVTMTNQHFILTTQ